MWVGFGIIFILFEWVRDGGKVMIWGDGNLVWDYFYIDDMVVVCWFVLDGLGGVYNIGVGVGILLNELV